MQRRSLERLLLGLRVGRRAAERVGVPPRESIDRRAEVARRVPLGRRAQHVAERRPPLLERVLALRLVLVLVVGFLLLARVRAPLRRAREAKGPDPTTKAVARAAKRKRW